MCACGWNVENGELYEWVVCYQEETGDHCMGIMMMWMSKRQPKSQEKLSGMAVQYSEGFSQNCKNQVCGCMPKRLQITGENCWP